MVSSSGGTVAGSSSGGTIAGVVPGSGGTIASGSGSSSGSSGGGVESGSSGSGTSSGGLTTTSGACGPANNTTVVSAPAANLCTTGTPTAVTLDGNEYIWQCEGTNTGDTTGCMATKGGLPVGGNIVGAITVTPQTGFTDSTGKVISIRGLNGLVADALQAFPAVMTDYPGMTAIRLNVIPDSDNALDIAQVVQEYNAANVVVEIEDHSGNQDNVAWYQQMASLYQTFPLVFLEVPNEPDDDLSVTPQNQIDIINAIRAAGFTNPIGIQAMGGFDESNYSVVTAAVGTQQLYAAPHEYYYGTDPNGAQQYLDELVSGAQAVGLFPWLDEFGNDAGDGVSPAPEGMTVITDIITENEAGTIAATFWAMDNGNHPDGTDSAFLTMDGTQLTPIGINPLQPWLSQTSGAP